MRVTAQFMFVISELLVLVIAGNNTSNDSKITLNNLDTGGFKTIDEFKLLSRRKRFLIFPDGSSFQLVVTEIHSPKVDDLIADLFSSVFCTQNHGYLQLGNIVWFGSTAALAWELPTDPQVFDMFRDRYKVYEASRRKDIIYYVDEDGKIVDTVEYHSLQPCCEQKMVDRVSSISLSLVKTTLYTTLSSLVKRMMKKKTKECHQRLLCALSINQDYLKFRKPIVNPAFAKRSISLESEMKRKYFVTQMHYMHMNIDLFEDLNAARIDFHRKGRIDLYGKLEKLLQELGWDGKRCVLKMLCEAGKARNKQGTFFQEIITSIFTLPEGQGYEREEQQYDVAHGTDADCARLYPECAFVL